MNNNNLLIEIRSLLYQAFWRVETENKNEALGLINEARTKLDEYLAQNGIVSGDWGEGREEQNTTTTKAEKVGPKVVRHDEAQSRLKLDGVGNPACPLYDKHVRISGTVDQIGKSRDEVLDAIQQLGAKYAGTGIVKSMDYVILGNNYGPAKEVKIKKWQDEGCGITVLSQFDLKKIFNEFLPDE